MRISDWSSDVCSSDLPEQVEALKRTRTGIIMGIDLMKKYGWKIGDRVSLHSTIWVRKDDGSSNWPFDIVGTYIFEGDESQNTGAFFNYSYFDEARTFGNGTVGWWTVSVKDPNQRSEEHTSELQSLMRISYAVFCL